MFRLFVVVVFLFSLASLAASAAEFEVEGVDPYEEEPVEFEPMIEPTPEIDPHPLVDTPEGEEGDIPIPIPRPVDEQGVEIDPDPMLYTPEEEEGSMPIPLPEPVGEEYDSELDPDPMF